MIYFLYKQSLNFPICLLDSPRLKDYLLPFSIHKRLVLVLSLGYPQLLTLPLIAQLFTMAFPSQLVSTPLRSYR